MVGKSDVRFSSFYQPLTIIIAQGLCIWLGSYMLWFSIMDIIWNIKPGHLNQCAWNFWWSLLYASLAVALYLVYPSCRCANLYSFSSFPPPAALLLLATLKVGMGCNANKLWFFSWYTSGLCIIVNCLSFVPWRHRTVVNGYFSWWLKQEVNS